MTKNRKVENLLSQPSHLYTVNVARFARNVEWDFSVIFKHHAFWQKQLLFCLGLYLVEGVKCVRVFKCRKNQWGFPPSLMPSVNSIAARSWKSIVMNRGSTLMKFGILALFFCPLISCRYTESIITRDDCGLATLVSNNRLKINLSYSNNMNCFVQLIFSEVKNFLLTIENFKVSIVSINNSSTSWVKS